MTRLTHGIITSTLCVRLSESVCLHRYNRLMLTFHNNPLTFGGFLRLVVCGSCVDYVSNDHAYDKVIPCVSFRCRDSHFIEFYSNLKPSPSLGIPVKYLTNNSSFILTQN